MSWRCRAGVEHFRDGRVTDMLLLRGSTPPRHGNVVWDKQGREMLSGLPNESIDDLLSKYCM